MRKKRPDYLLICFCRLGIRAPHIIAGRIRCLIFFPTSRVDLSLSLKFNFKWQRRPPFSGFVGILMILYLSDRLEINFGLMMMGNHQARRENQFNLLLILLELIE